ncbi:5'-AMP-activated protein kinase subunit beta-2 [Sciurus carolinensis]|uniref:Flavin-containing monooxygenase n=1 Tax=Sciurus carolinensis TaxID=30640 RepID=A0AA41TA61_SCICA|nr:5'-AMP-activated protein kinase subunit beta-2 [Sciurus carolinensis]
MTKKRIAVIGIEACGLSSVKWCLDEDLESVCFERTDDLGGLWRYQRLRARRAMAAIPGKEHKIIVGSTSDPGVFSLLDFKLPGKKEFVSWQQDLDDSIKPTQQAHPTVICWSEGGKEFFISGSFSNWSTKILLIKRNLTDLMFSSTAIMTSLPSRISLWGEKQYKIFVVGQWIHDPSEPMVTSQLGMISNLTHVKKSYFEVFDALKLDSMERSETSCQGKPLVFRSGHSGSKQLATQLLLRQLPGAPVVAPSPSAVLSRLLYDDPSCPCLPLQQATSVQEQSLLVQSTHHSPPPLATACGFDAVTPRPSDPPRFSSYSRQTPGVQKWSFWI